MDKVKIVVRDGVVEEVYSTIAENVDVEIEYLSMLSQSNPPADMKLIY